MARFIDSHVHLADPAFDADRDGVIARARLAGALALVSIGESLGAADRAERLAHENPGYVYWTAGVHPHDAAGFDGMRDLERLREHVHRGAVAIGECGLDYYYDHAPRDAQRHAFARQLALAKELSRPVVVHSREAVADTAAMVSEAGKEGILGVLHCFSGPPSLAEVALDAGWFVSFSGVVTFKKWDDEALLRLPPDDRVLIETDAPYLAPAPHRGKRNEPALAVHTLAKVASARGTPLDEFGRLTARNTKTLFALAIDVNST